ncbi:hypothetical protein Tco_0186938, partial [Tanacetum coccineum]
MCDKKHSVLFTDTECVVLSPDFKLTDESHVLRKVPRKDNMYSVDLKNIVPQGGLQFNQPTITNVTHGFVWPNICKKFNEEDVLPSIENLIDIKVKVIRCDNRTECKN